MIIEVVCYSLESAITAQEAGASRIELCGGFTEGGTTPSCALIELVQKKMHIPVYIMIRPRGGDFLYSDSEYEVMIREIEICKTIGVTGVVFGILQPDGSLDIKRCTSLIQHAMPMKVTLHRAFDRTSDPLKALEDAILCGFERILTSGQQKDAVEGIEFIKNLISCAADRIIIMPGCGLTDENILQFHMYVNASEYHLSGKKLVLSKMEYYNNVCFDVHLNSVNDYVVHADALKIRRVVDLVRYVDI